MLVARNLALLAEVVSVTFTDDARASFKIEFEEHSHGLFSNGGKSAIYLLPLAGAKTVPTPKRKELEAVFREFTAAPVETALEIDLPRNHVELTKIGYVREIEYLSDKWGQGKILYVHEYETRCQFYASKSRFDKARAFGILSETGRKLISKRGLIS